MKNAFYKLISTKLRISLLLIFTLVILIVPNAIFAQGMMGRSSDSITPNSTDLSTSQEEVEGKAIWEKLQTKQIQCKDLKDEDFDILGEYFMGQRVGVAHAAMNTMMIQMMGEQGETQMHISLGKRLSGCDTGAPIPTNGSGFLPMMGINGRFPMMGGFGSGMMGGWYGSWGLIGSFISFLIIIFLVLGIIYFWKGIAGKGRK